MLQQGTPSKAEPDTRCRPGVGVQAEESGGAGLADAGLSEDTRDLHTQETRAQLVLRTP